MASLNLVALPQDIMFMLPKYLHNIEDLMNTASTCRRLRECMASAIPNVILQLAVAQSRVFFRPSPLFLVTATARQLGNWARRSRANEDKLALKLEEGVDGLLDLALDHCGLTMERIRELRLLRFSLINPVEDIIDKCVGHQRLDNPDFWHDGLDDEYTIDTEPSDTLFHLAMYGELFAPDFEPILNQDSQTRRLSVETRLEFIKYCLPDFACHLNGHIGSSLLLNPGETLDPRREVKQTGPYAKGPDGRIPDMNNNNLALTWVIRSSHFRRYYKALRAKAGEYEFQERFDDGWWFNESSHSRLPGDYWRQRLWENVMISQGLEGLEMLRPDTEDKWIGKIKEWREKIMNMDNEPPLTKVGRQATLEYPYLLGDLRICASGYVTGT
ncbi:hypothetical protein F5B22DRAFT_397744 [Xylaria bambusicola]|uniref:uncharacterized protein n=1 Tax=Xylaria bambusicola TaxID=326684 RepID=UPI002008AED9|nr:uncharacterized protein F5B22DRAFT_397744 [Xylaria bambusicola]KAI0508461.1 hypothetical protein F5B22DRAFT_397744 [Xylaria bambusicola]